MQAAEVDILIGSMGNGLGAGGGFCAGSYHVCKHQVSCSIICYTPIAN